MPEKVAWAMDPKIMNSAMGAAVGTGAALAMNAGVLGIIQGARSGYERLSRKRDLKSILEVYPDLNSYDDSEIQLAYRSLRHLNPHFASDPLVGGTLLKQILRSRDPSNPKSIRFEPGIAVDLTKSRPRENYMLEQMATDAVSTGVRDGMRQYSDLKATHSDRAWRDQNETDKRTADESFRRESVQQAQNFQAHSDTLRERAQGRAATKQHGRAMKMEALKGRMKVRQGLAQAHLSKAAPDWHGPDDAQGKPTNMPISEVAENLFNSGIVARPRGM